MTFNIFIVGGNGFVGSAVCRAAVRRGWKVKSISKSGKPFTTPNGHLPAWTEKVEWHAASAFDPASYRSLVSSSNAVVHTLGTLLESAEYKESLKRGDGIGALISSARSAINSLNGRNPLASGTEGSYESVNHDSAISVCETFLSEASPASSFTSKRTFVYISAEDVFRPAISTRYITTKRQAEKKLEELCSHATTPARSVSIRPSFIYHPHIRPISSPIAAALQAVGGVHSSMGEFSPVNFISRLASAVEPTQQYKDEFGIDGVMQSVQCAVTIPPIHVDHVGEAVCEAIQEDSISGPVGVWQMRRMLGWTEEGHNHRDFYANM